MKSIFKLSALALLATALTVSCEKEMDVEDVAAHQMERHTFTLAFAQPDTKLAITNEGKTTWEVGDEIMIHGGTDGKLRQKVTLTADDISADGKKATITFEMDPYDRTDAGVVSKFYAQYPASLVPEGAMYYECRFTGTNAPLMAACDVNDTFVFYNLCGIITFEADGEFDNFVFAGNGGETVGYSSVYQVRVRLDNGKEAPSVNYYKPGNGSGDPVAMKEFAAEKIDGVNYIYLPVGTNFSEGFNFKFYDGEELVKVAKTTTAVNVAAGKILALGDITGKLETYTPPTTSDHQPAEWAASATDLSVGKQAPANTYVLTAPGAYKIPAVKGNTTEAVGNVFDVELVWETYNNTEEVVKNSIIAEVDFDNDNLYFKTPDALKPGNALIAAKDYEGKIIWSWHIWIPSTAITTLEANGMFGTDVMDRNLGALTAVSGAATAESAGFLYQWGRKDPFMGVGAMAANTSTTMTTTGTFTKSKEQISVTTALANPTMFAYNGATAVDPDWKGLNWCTAENGDAWGTAEEKGVYDPCPAGYRVPAYNSSLPGWAKEDWTYDEANFYYKYSDAIFPFAGYLDDCSGSLSHGGDRSAFWSGTAYNADKGYSVDVRFKSGAATHSVTSQYKARGNSVRCVKIDGWVDPTPQTKAPAIEHVWGWYSSTDALWTSNVTAISITHPDGYGMARGLAMDDEYIYLPKSSGYAAIAGVKITDGATQVKGSVSGVNVGSTFQTSFVRMMKNTDASVNGGKDILLLSNLTSTDAANLVIYAYTSGIENAPVILAQFAWDSANNVADWRRYGDRFFVTGTWQDGKIYLPSYNANKTVVLSVANGARTAVQQIAAGDASPDGIKDLTVYPGSNSLFLTNASIANLVAPTGGTSAQGWDEYKLSASSANGIGTWGYNFFTFNEKNYIAYARTSGNKAWVEVIEDKGDLLASLEAQEGLLKAPIHAADNLDAEHATGGVADCAVRVIDGVVYIASLTRDGGLSVDKLVLK